MTKLRVVVLLAVVALLLFPAMAVAQETPPQPPCRFYGTVTLDGASVADGTVIKAIVGGDEYTATTPAVYGASSYAIEIVEPAGATYDGATVSFMIGERTAAQTSIWTMGANVNVDLTAGEGTIPTDGGIASVEVVTIGSGDDAYATLSGGILTLYIPEGPKGDTGNTGPAGPQGEEGPGAPGGIALPVVALVIAIIAAGIAVMGMRRRV